MLEKILAVMPEGPKYFPEDELTDQRTRFMVAEIIREQVLLAASEEVPHATTVMVEEFEEGAVSSTRISAVLFASVKDRRPFWYRQRRTDAQDDWYGGTQADRKRSWERRYFFKLF